MPLSWLHTVKGGQSMRKSAIGIVIVGVAASLALSACSSSKKTTAASTSASSSSAATSAPATSGSATSAPVSSPAVSSSGSAGGGTFDGKGAKVGIILPDTISSPRWVSSDPAALKAACTKDNLVCDIQNADGSASKMQTIAQSMEADGIKALMIVNLDSKSGATIEQAANKLGIITVDYDRLTLGGGASLYVSFDNTKVGTLQGTALTQCAQVKGKTAVKYVEIDGAATDNNATLFHAGYDAVLSKTPGWTKVAGQSGNWDGPTAGKIFNTMLGATPGIQAVMVANDTMANAVVTDLQSQHLNGQVAVSGQDASSQGLQHIMDGDQCFTIYKPTSQESGPAIDAIAQLLSGKTPAGTTTISDTQTKKDVPALLATPIGITKENVAAPINSGDTSKSGTCTGAYVAKCTAAGVK
jgi:D-xylose transport system substrate-binding protein